MVEKLTNNEWERVREKIPHWILSKNNSCLKKDFLFKDFKEAFYFMQRIALIADHMNHHPEWAQIYNKVSIRLTTHESGGVTEKDIDLALKIEENLN